MSKSRDVLAEIVCYKRAVVKQQQQQKPLADLIQQLTPSFRSLEQALCNPQSDFILECKKSFTFQRFDPTRF
ncbi:MAG: hypothetical protein Q9M92_04235 [Enterobacterales bacterium]|nr:hypothetical protein [Enterobacterales bacterium]